MNDNWQTSMTLLRKLAQVYDDYAWQEFVGYYSSYIRMVLYRVGVTGNDLDDLVQDVLLKVWKSLPDYNKREGVKFRTWLTQVIRSCAFSWHRKHPKVETISLDEYTSFELAVESNLDTIIDAEWKKYISEMAWENIKPQFTTVALNIFEEAASGKSNIVIGKTFNIKVNTVAVYKKRVLQALYYEIARLDYELNN